MVEGCIQCPYHGWEYDGAGNCTRMPSTAFCKGISVSSLPVTEADGFIWVWPGQRLPEAAVPAVTQPPEGFDVSLQVCPTQCLPAQYCIRMSAGFLTFPCCIVLFKPNLGTGHCPLHR